MSTAEFLLDLDIKIRAITSKITTHRCVTDGGIRLLFCDKSYSNGNLVTAIFNCASAKCKVCLDLNWNSFPFQLCQWDRHSGTLLPREDEAKSIVTKMPILESSQDSCNSCKVLYMALKRSYQWRLEDEQEALDYSDFDVQIILLPGFTVHVYASNYSSGEILPHIELFTEAGRPSPWKAIGPASHRSKHPPTIYSSVDFIKKHLAMCSSHPTCRQSTSELPARVVDVRELAKPRLLSSHGRRAKYLTLSHCWGSRGYEPLVTKKLSLAEHHTGIPWASLSPTFQYAILITQKLGFGFLWIDSLCIVQDDPLDWETESTKMAEIYMNSELTISAASAEDGRDGCIVPRPRQPVEEHLFPQSDVQDEARSKAENVFIRYPAFASHCAVDPLPRSTENMKYARKGSILNETAPLVKRAWVFQESVLSRRSILFHSQELIWECRHSLSCECGHLSWLRTRRIDLCRRDPSRREYFPTPGWKPPFATLELAGESTIEVITEQWYKLILAYSGLQITYETDRLPALSGLASAFSRKLKTTYLAGLWESDLWRGLLWLRPEFFGRDTQCRRLMGDACSIPTWSWASIVREEHDNAPVFEFASTTFEALKKDDRFAVVSANCTTSTTNIFGNVSGGVLQLRGALIETLVSRENLGLNLKDYELLLIGNDLNGPTEFYPAYSADLQHHLVFDVGFGGVPKEIPPNSAVYCLCVAVRSTYTGDGTGVKIQYCLVLEELREKTYRRVGLLIYIGLGIKEGKDRNWTFNVDTPYRDWFEDAPIVEVNIV